MNWWKGLKSKISFREPLKKHTSFKIGGPAEFFIEPKDENDLRLLLIVTKKNNMPVLLLGAGSNILAGDKGVKAAVLKLNALSFKKISFKDSHLEAGSGLMLGQIVKAAQDHGLSGIEFLAGIPGTVGGALIMNAGAWGKNIGDAVSRVKVMDYNGKVKVLKRKDIKFAYRSSSLEKFIILSADFKLSKRNKKEIKEDIKMLVQRRRGTQDLCSPSAGCIFKNPEGGSAGRLIDLCGLKGKTQGRAYISSKHANFILNQGGARAADVLKLMDLAQKKVKTKFKLTLKPEIKIWH